MVSKLNLQKKLLLGLTVILVVLIILLSFSFYYYQSSVTINDQYKTSQKTTERTSSQIDELFRQMDMAALFIVKNSVIQTVLTAMHNDKNISEYQLISYGGQARDQLKIISFYFPDITNAVIFDSSRGFYFHSGLPDEEEVLKKRLSDLNWYKSLIPQEKQFKIIPTHQDYWVSISRPVISVIRKLLTSSGGDLGLFELDIPYWNLEKICKTNAVSDSSGIMVFDDQGRLIYPLDYPNEDNSIYKSVNPTEIYGKITPGSDSAGQLKTLSSRVLYTSHKSNYTRFTTILVTKDTLLQKQLYTYSYFVIIAGFIILLAVFFAFFVLVRGLTKPLKQLTSTIENVSLDNMNLEIPHGGYDEIKMLNESFNAMFTKLKDSINLVYEAKIRETNANLLALQAQINPHFLYNTLGVISASSEKFGNSNTASMCNKLSDMLRYTVSPVDSMVTLKDEINHTLNYLDLMCSHYQDYRNNSESLLKYEIDIPEEMNFITLPRMTLQPLVENCINHGFENTLPPWYIIIRGEVSRDNIWHISIEDNGSGFEPGILGHINSQINDYYTNLKDGNFKQNLHAGGMGILNTYARLAINFKEFTVFNIENKQPYGCMITIGGKML